MPVINLYPAPAPISLESLQIEVCGLEQPLRTVSGRELGALQSVALKVPLICQIFNWSEVVEWEGVRFADFLEAFRIETHREGYYAIYSRDGVYFETLSADEARDPRVLLAYKLNGELLSEANGGPLRLVVPFLQGYKSVKWVDSVLAFRKDPIGIKRLLGQSPTGQLNSGWLARYGITLPAGRPGDPPPLSADTSGPSPAVPAGPVLGVSASPSDTADLEREAQTGLKEILAFIRPQRHQVTRQALEAAGVVSYTSFRVLGRGRQGGLKFPDATKAEAAIRFLPKQCFSIVVEESQVPAALEAILKVNRTGPGEHGDGKVFVLDVSDAVRISTDERGSAAV
ncbi:MAG: molybdopterin-dependent oxidoreductase [Acidobacteria bacterium]|nr:molybdopterin-dependent oxidoreductase [Acidobacteriota bacterium]